MYIQLNSNCHQEIMMFLVSLYYGPYRLKTGHKIVPFFEKLELIEVVFNRTDKNILKANFETTFKNNKSLLILYFCSFMLIFCDLFYS